jgi:hypothetical protein
MHNYSQAHQLVIIHNLAARWPFIIGAAVFLNEVFEKLETANYMNKWASQFCVFKNKFAFVRNTQKLRWFVNA